MSRMATRKTSTSSKSKSKQQQQQNQKKKKAGNADVSALNDADATSNSSSSSNRKRPVQMATHPNRTKEALLRRINPKASRKKVLNGQKDARSGIPSVASSSYGTPSNRKGSRDKGGAVVVVMNGGTSVRNHRFQRNRLSNFSSSLKTTNSLKKNRTTTKTKTTVHNPNLNHRNAMLRLETKEITARHTKDTTPVSSSKIKNGDDEEEKRVKVAVVVNSSREKKQTTHNKQTEINKEKRPTATAAATVPTATMADMKEATAPTNNKSAFTLISTNSSSKCKSDASDTSSVGRARTKDKGNNQRQDQLQPLQETTTTAASSDDGDKSKQQRDGCDDDFTLRIVDTIERVASGTWVDSLEATSTSSSSVGSDRASNETRNNKKTTQSATSNKKRSVRLDEVTLPASPPVSTDGSSRRRPNQNRRLACLNAMAKVHCLYESEVRYSNPSVAVMSKATTTATASKVTKKANVRKRVVNSSSSSSSSSDSSSSSSSSSSDDSDSDDSDSDSSSSSEDDNRTVVEQPKTQITKSSSAAKKVVTKKKSEISKKKPPDKKKMKVMNNKKKEEEKKKKKQGPVVTTAKKRQSMEVPSVINLSDLVMPKRMASLNATAILAASSQNWSDNNRSSSSSSAAASSSRRSNQQQQSLTPTTVRSVISNKKKATKIPSKSSDVDDDDDSSDDEERITVAASEPKKMRKSNSVAPTAPKKSIKSHPAAMQETKKDRMLATKIKEDRSPVCNAISGSSSSSYSAAAATLVTSGRATAMSSLRVSTHSIHRMTDIIETTSSADVVRQVEKKIRANNSSSSSGVASRSHAMTSSNRRVASRVVEIIEETSTSSLNSCSSSSRSSQKQSAAAGEQQCVAAAADRYSPLGALYNMRPPNGGAGTAVTTQQRNQADDNNVDDGKQQQQLTVGGGVKVVTSPTSSGSGSGINANQQVAKEQSPSDASNTNKLMWTPERLISSMPPVHFGGVPLVLSNPIQAVDQSYATATRFAPAFSLYRPPFDIPYTSFYQPPPLPLNYPIPSHHFAPSPFYRGFALLPPNGSGFVPVALADTYSAAYAFAQAPPAIAAGPAIGGPDHWSYLLHRYQQPQLALPCNSLTRYLPTIAPCPTDFLNRTRATISLDELPSASTSATNNNGGGSSNTTTNPRDTNSTMHGDRNPLALTASEAAAASSSSSSSSSSAAPSALAPAKTSGTLKMSETASASNHSILFPFPSTAPSLGMAAAAATAAAYANRCLSGNCSCTGGQSSQACPKNVQAGPLTGEGKRSEPNSIPRRSCQVIPPPSGGAANSSSSPAVSSPPFFTNGPLQTGTGDADLRSMTAATVVTQSNGDRHDEENRSRKRKSDSVLFLQKNVKRIAVQNSAVSTRLRSRPSPSSLLFSESSTATSVSCIGLECSNKSQSSCCCCNLNVAPTNKILLPHMKAGEAVVITLDDSNGNHYTESNMNGAESQTTTTDLDTADKLPVIEQLAATDVSSSRKRRKQHMIQRHDYEFISSFHSSTPPPTEPVCMKPFKEEPNRSSEERNKSVLKKKTATGAKAKENTKSTSPSTTSMSNSISQSINPIRKTSVQLLPTSKATVTGGGGVGKTSSIGGSGSVLQGFKSRSLCTTPPLRWSNGWSWEGTPFQSLVHLRNEDAPATALRKCYPAMRHTEGDVVRTRDCILLKSGPKAKDLPFVAKVSALWENDEDGEMMMSLLWYYRPEHTDGGRRASDLDDDIFASRHRDVCSVACIEDKCYVLTFNEYCRYRKQAKMLEMGLSNPFAALVQPFIGQSSDYPRRSRLPPACTSHDRVFICRKVYDYRQKRILKNKLL